MTEINNNISNFGFKGKIENKKENTAGNTQSANTHEPGQGKYILDTGVLGRSQINVKGADSTKSVDEAVALAKNNPAVLNASETLFDSIYQQLLQKDVNPDDAYFNALTAEGDFLELAYKTNM